MKEIFFVFVGGGAGSVLRYATSMLWQHLSLHPKVQESSILSTALPWPTLIVNVLGCFLIGLFYSQSERWGLSSEARLMLTTGFCGGLTTFSTFSNEGFTLLRNGMYTTYALYFVLSIALGIIAVFAGYRL